VCAPQNTLVAQKDLVKRSDFVLCADTIDNMKFLKLKLFSSKVVPFGETADSQISPHFAVGARFNF